MPIQLANQLFRVVAKSQPPEVKTFGSNTVMNFTLVPAWSKDSEAATWIKGELWNKDVEKWDGQLQHNDTLLLSGSLSINDNKNSTDDNKLMPYFNLRIDGFNMTKVQRIKLEDSSQGATQATEDVIAAKIAASNVDDTEEIPF